MKNQCIHAPAPAGRRKHPARFSLATVVIALLALIQLPATADPVDELDKENGYGGVLFGSPTSALPAADFKETFRSKSGRYRIMAPKKNDHKFEGEPVQEVCYFFFDDKFYSVYLKLADRDTANRIATTVFNKYGKAPSEGNYGPSYYGAMVGMEIFSKQSDVEPRVVIKSLPLYNIWHRWKFSGLEPDLKNQF